jgi:hypothetical protein
MCATKSLLDISPFHAKKIQRGCAFRSQTAMEQRHANARVRTPHDRDSCVD